MADGAMSPPSEGEVKMEIHQADSRSALTPPTSENTDKKDDESGSELSDLEPEEAPEKHPVQPKVENVEEIVPDHYYEGGRVPVFKPTMNQFRSFKEFIQKIDKYGMKSGIVKVIPPKEWRDSLPSLDEQVKTIKVKNPITQEFHGTHGTYTQANIEKQRSYNLPQWKALTEESSHQPPAKRGERRRNQEKPARAPSTRVRNSSGANTGPKKRGPGRPRIRPLPATVEDNEEEAAQGANGSRVETPLTPVSPPLGPKKMKKEQFSDDEIPKPKGRQPKSGQSKSVSSRRQHNRRDQADVVDEEAFKDFDYRVYNQGEWTTERIQELETAYWKSLNFSNPLYGADMPGSLFDNSTKEWNVAKLENLLDVLGQSVPGVNTAYLYLGMWKASFAWHLEDVDLYSINYIHFGAPKQWYSISQADARRFETTMRSIWPNDAKNCDQFLRHKTYLISPQLLESQHKIKVNRLVHNEGEFVITFPYGYHSGYNLGYNCAESVNFATEAWLDYGKVARKCNCEADSVWVDVRDIERKLRGEPTPEYYEETEDDDDDDDDEPTDLPTPPSSDKGKPKRSHKRKRDPNEKDTKPKIKKLRIKMKAPAYEPCILCPNDNSYEELLPTDNGHKAHRRCGLYTPETYISEEGGFEKICDVAHIDKARLELKCNHCRSKKGAVFQCSQKKCVRAFHATCAAQAGVLVDIGLVPVYGEDGTEYTDTGIDFRCRIHRGRRGKNVEGAHLEENFLIRKTALKLPVGEVVQMQYLQGDIFAGVVLENRKSEQTLLIHVLPRGDKIEVEYKWLLVFDPVNSQLPMPSENAKPLPAELARKSRTTMEDPANNDDPKPNDPFGDPDSNFRWEEFDSCKAFRNPAQVKIDFDKPSKLWYYIGKSSTEAKAHYTAKISIRQNDPTANFLESVRIASVAAAAAKPTVPRLSYPASYPSAINHQNAPNAPRPSANVHVPHSKTPTTQYTKPAATKERPYHGKYAITDPIAAQYKPRPGVNVDAQALYNQRAFQNAASSQLPQQYHTHQSPSYRAPQAPMGAAAPTASMMSGQPQASQDYKSHTKYNYNYNRTPMPYQQTNARPQYPQQQQNRPLHTPQPALYSRPQAPVANMMGVPPTASTPTTNQHPVNGPLSAQRRPSSVPSTLETPILPTAPPPETKKISRINVSEKYTYLHDAEKARPQVYQSPYALEGGFSSAYLPAPAAAPKTRPRGPSVSEEYLMTRTPSQQDQINHDSMEAKPQTYQASHSQQQAQYQSPQDFQLQLQREAQRSPQGGWLDQFSRGLQNAANHGGSQAVPAYSGTSNYGGIGYSSGGGGQGSPLKYEMGGAGTEMLPMMREGGRY
ncbi:MAG: hypothetical protein ASARMPRED_000204 [Alectoria sarmentosa]|nr:MAG: hypothetical protein ASARMPRED_000204 [Alectoria sarmentosa]